MKAMRLVMVVAGLAACGGSKQEDSTTPIVEQVGQDSTDPEDISDEGMVPPEKMEEIQRLLERRRPAVSRCLSAAVDAKELPKSARGKITLAIVVGTGSRADSVKVISSTLESEILTKCVVEKVHEIPWPEIPKAYETTYSYGFEAM